MSRRNATFLGTTAGVLLLWLFSGESLSWREAFIPGSPTHEILWELRLPRLVLVLIAGGALALVGATYQILFHNPLAEPYVLGVSSAVTLGAAVAEILLGSTSFLASGATGFCLALLTVTTLLWVGGTVERTILFGMGINFVLSSLLFLLLSYHQQQLGGGSLRWLFGQIPWLSHREALGIAAFALPFVVVLILFARKLDALSLGDAVARTLGVRPQRARNAFLLTTSLFLAALVSFTGSIGFVGLVVPHGVRLFFRPPSARSLLALSFLAGSLFLTVSDAVSRSLLIPLEFPIGVVTTLLGGPVFLWLLWKR